MSQGFRPPTQVAAEQIHIACDQSKGSFLVFLHTRAEIDNIGKHDRRQRAMRIQNRISRTHGRIVSQTSPRRNRRVVAMKSEVSSIDSRDCSVFFAHFFFHDGGHSFAGLSAGRFQPASTLNWFAEHWA